MLKKLEIQRKKQLKKQRFALADENEEDTLTHGGKELDRVFVLCVFHLQSRRRLRTCTVPSTMTSWETSTPIC